MNPGSILYQSKKLHCIYCGSPVVMVDRTFKVEANHPAAYPPTRNIWSCTKCGSALAMFHCIGMSKNLKPVEVLWNFWKRGVFKNVAEVINVPKVKKVAPWISGK